MIRILLYGCFVLIAFWALIWYLWGDLNWLLYCLNRSAPFLYIPGLLIPLISIAVSHRLSVSLLSFLPIIIFLFIFWPYLVPKNGEQNPDDLRIMTYNILCTNDDIHGIAELIRRHLPDLIAFQEMTEDQFTKLSGLLSQDYPYQNIGYQVPCGSTAVFSRLPITEHRVLDLMSDRPATLAAFLKDDKPFIFVSAHLLPMYRARIQPLGDRPSAINEFIADKTRQVGILTHALNEFDSMPVIIGCDCNTLLSHSAYRTLSEYFVDTATVVGRPISIDNAIKNGNPYQLDYIFYRGSVNPVANYRVDDSGGSDHLPVMAHFAIDQRKY